MGCSSSNNAKAVDLIHASDNASTRTDGQNAQALDNSLSKAANNEANKLTTAIDNNLAEGETNVGNRKESGVAATEKLITSAENQLTNNANNTAHSATSLINNPENGVDNAVCSDVNSAETAWNSKYEPLAIRLIQAPEHMESIAKTEIAKRKQQGQEFEQQDLDQLAAKTVDKAIDSYSEDFKKMHPELSDSQFCEELQKDIQNRLPGGSRASAIERLAQILKTEVQNEANNTTVV